MDAKPTPCPAGQGWGRAHPGGTSPTADLPGHCGSQRLQGGMFLGEEGAQGWGGSLPSLSVSARHFPGGQELSQAPSPGQGRQGPLPGQLPPCPPRHLLLTSDTALFCWDFGAPLARWSTSVNSGPPATVTRRQGPEGGACRTGVLEGAPGLPTHRQLPGPSHTASWRPAPCTLTSQACSLNRRPSWV